MKSFATLPLSGCAGVTSSGPIQRPIKDRSHGGRQKPAPQERAVDVPMDLLDAGKLKADAEAEAVAETDAVAEAVAEASPEVAPQVTCSR